MKKILILLILNSTFIILHCQAQVLCVYCYHQNEPVSNPINNLVINGGFENPGCISGSFCPSSSYYSCDISDWTCTGGGGGTYAQVFDASGYAWYGVFLSMVPEGDHAVYMGNYFSNS